MTLSETVSKEHDTTITCRIPRQVQGLNREGGGGGSGTQNRQRTHPEPAVLSVGNAQVNWALGQWIAQHARNTTIRCCVQHGSLGARHTTPALGLPKGSETTVNPQVEGPGRLVGSSATTICRAHLKPTPCRTVSRKAADLVRMPRQRH